MPGIWESVYSEGQQLNRWPFDAVVAFVFKNRERRDARLIEIGFGAGNNLWFAAREGLRVAGVESEEQVVEYARRRFEEEGLHGDLRVGDLTSLPFESATFDLAVDRAVLSCVPLEAAKIGLSELRRVLRPGGRALLTPYSAAQTERKGYVWPSITFYTREMLDALLADWEILDIEHVVMERNDGRIAEWRVTASVPLAFR